MFTTFSLVNHLFATTADKVMVKASVSAAGVMYWRKTVIDNCVAAVTVRAGNSNLSTNSQHFPLFVLISAVRIITFVTMKTVAPKHVCHSLFVPSETD